jgi:hypothetical protein
VRPQSPKEHNTFKMAKRNIRAAQKKNWKDLLITKGPRPTPNNVGHFSAKVFGGAALAQCSALTKI